MKTYSLKKIDELSGGDADFAQAIIMTFAEETPMDVAQLASSIDQEDFEAIYKSAHKIKPNLDLLCVEEAHQQILRIEQLGRSNNGLQEIKELFAAVDITISNLLQELKSDFDL